MTFDAAYALLHEAGRSVGDTAYVAPDRRRLIWLVYAHRGEQQIVAKAKSQTAAWNEAVRFAAKIEAEVEPTVQSE